MTSYAHKALRGAITVFVISLISSLVAYSIRFLLARKLSVEEYGLFFALLSFISLIGLFKDLGLGYALLKFIPELQVAKNWGKIKSLIASSFLIQLISSGIIAILFAVFSKQIMTHVFHTDKTWLGIVFALIFFVSFAPGIIMICFQSFQRMFLFSIYDLSKNALAFIIMFILLGFGLGIAAPAFAYLIMYGVLFIIFSIVFTSKVFPQFWKAKTEWAKQDFSRLLLFGLPAMLTIFGHNVLNYTDTILITYFTGLTQAGLYQAAVPLAGVVLYLGYAISAVTTPLVSELNVQKKRKELRTGIKLLHKYILLGAIPPAAGLLVFPELFISVFFGQKFIEASTALMILSVGILFYTIAYVNIGALFGLGQPRQTTKIMLATIAINILLNITLIPKYGIIGAASATSASYLFLLWASSRRIHKTVKVSAQWLVWTKNILAGLLLTASLLLIKKYVEFSPLKELAVCIIAGIIIYCVLLALLKIITWKEIIWMKDQILLRKTK